MKKKLNETDIANELRGASLFFQKSPAAVEEGAPAPKPRRRVPSAKKAATLADAVVAEPEAMPTATEVESTQSVPESLEPTKVDPGEPAPDLDHHQLVESIRKAVKRLGKEATFCRFTQEEKNALGDIIYTYKRGGIRTSENEVIRIAVNWLLENYHRDGRNSVLAQVLDKLNA